MDSNVAFRAAVDWNERWIQGLLAFHVVLWLFFIFARKHFNAQVGGTSVRDYVIILQKGIPSSAPLFLVAPSRTIVLKNDLFSPPEQQDQGCKKAQ